MEESIPNEQHSHPASPSPTPIPETDFQLNAKLNRMSQTIETIGSTLQNINSNMQSRMSSLELHFASLQRNVGEIQVDPEIQFNMHANNHPRNNNQNTNQSTGDHRTQTHFNKVHMKPQTYDGCSDIGEYLTQFNLISELNGWDESTKALYLASSLTGNARSLLCELSELQKRDYYGLVDTLRRRYGTQNKAEIFRSQLKSITRKEGQSIADLAQSVKKLTRQAYPDAHSDLIEILALDHFIDSLNDADIRLRLRECCPKTVMEAETIAVRLETHKLADQQRLNPVNAYTKDSKEPGIHSPNRNIESLIEKVELLSERVEQISSHPSKSIHPQSNNSQYRNRYSTDTNTGRQQNRNGSSQHHNMHNGNTQHAFNRNVSQNNRHHNNRNTVHQNNRYTKPNYHPMNRGRTQHFQGNENRSSWRTAARPQNH